jgi:L-malate glycosyltransferase
MFVCVIANIDSIHTKKIVRYLTSVGHRAAVISFDHSNHQGIEFHYIKIPSIIKSRKLKYLYSVPSARRLVQKLKPDILLSIYLLGPGFLGALCGYHPHIAMAIGSDVLLEMDKSLFYRFITKYYFKKIEGFIALSRGIADKLIERGIPKTNIVVNPIGIDTTIFNFSDISNAKQRFQIVSTRSLEPVYNINQFIDSLPFIVSTEKNIDVRIIGTGTQYDTIKKKIEDYHIEDQVKLLGNVPLSLLVETLKNSDIFISMSLSDGAPVSLFEAMACGCFPVVSDIPANREWIKEGINGFLIPIGDSVTLANRIIEAFRNPALLEDAKKINRQIVEDNLEITKLMGNLIQYLKSYVRKK